MIGRMRTWGLVGAACVAAALVGCASGKNESGPHAECPVCVENADLACINVKITDSTPRAEYQGTTYYFCSEACKKEFLKNPAKFVHKKQ